LSGNLVLVVLTDPTGWARTRRLSANREPGAPHGYALTPLDGSGRSRHAPHYLEHAFGSRTPGGLPSPRCWMITFLPRWPPRLQIDHGMTQNRDFAPRERTHQVRVPASGRGASARREAPSWSSPFARSAPACRQPGL